MRDEIREAAERIWKMVDSAHHWGDGYQSAFESLVSEMETIDQAAEERGRREMREDPRLLAAARLADGTDRCCADNNDCHCGALLTAYREAVKASTPRPEDEGGGG